MPQKNITYSEWLRKVNLIIKWANLPPNAPERRKLLQIIRGKPEEQVKLSQKEAHKRLYQEVANDTERDY